MRLVFDRQTTARLLCKNESAVTPTIGLPASLPLHYSNEFCSALRIRPLSSWTATSYFMGASVAAAVEEIKRRAVGVGGHHSSVHAFETLQLQGFACISNNSNGFSLPGEREQQSMAEISGAPEIRSCA